MLTLTKAKALSQTNRAYLSFAGLMVATFLVLIYRRPDQFFNPYIWVEDGRVILPDFAASGWMTLFHPIVGYFILPVKLIFALAATISFRALPQISYWLTVAFTGAVVAAIAFSPTQLRCRVGCAVAPLLIPTDSEVFGVSLYTGWWGTLLAVLPLFWRVDGPPRTVLRILLLIIGGLSSPLIIGLTPLYTLRAIVLRSRLAFVDFAVCLALAITQGAALVLSSRMPRASKFDFSLHQLVEKFFGYFLRIATTPTQSDEAFVLGAVMLFCMAAVAFSYRRALGKSYVLLLACLAVAIFFSIACVPLSAIHPSLAGPRYFFLPYIFLAWSILQLASASEGAFRLVAVAVLAFAARNAVDVAQRRHDSIDWREQIVQCEQSESFALPVHFAGSKNLMWSANLAGADCRKLVRQSWLDNNVSVAGSPPEARDK